VLPIVCPEVRSGRKHYGFPAILLGKCFVDQRLRVLLSLHRIGNPSKNLVQIPLRYIPEQFRVLPADGLQTHDSSFQCHRNNDLQWADSQAHFVFPSWYFVPFVAYDLASIILHLAPISGISTNNGMVCAC
jgi:hypothetical protein